MAARGRLAAAASLAAAVTVLACSACGTDVDDRREDGAGSSAASEGIGLPARGAGAWPEPDEAVIAPVKALVVGTWPIADPGEFGTGAWLDEAGLRETFTMRRASRREWVGLQAPGPGLPIDRLLGDREGPAVGYAYLLVTRDDPAGEFAPTPALLHVRHRGRLQARLDGRIVADAPAPAEGWGEVRAPVTLTGPYDVLLLKLGRGGALGPSMDVEIRLSARDGAPLPGQGWQTMRPPGRPSDLERPEWCGRDG